jgi:uncharacterized membrane protein (DUF485 family)
MTSGPADVASTATPASATSGEPAAAQESSKQPPGRASVQPPAPRTFRLLRTVGGATAFAQAVVLIIYSAHIYAHFDLTLDFGVFNQGWNQIAHGHLDPYSTINPHNYPHYGYPFLHDHFALIMWPLALLWWVYPHGIDLLILQDLATAGSTFVAFLFVVDLFQRPIRDEAVKPRFRMRGTLGPVALSIGVLVLLVASPWVWWSDSFDFHLEAVATFFLLMAARDLWFGHWRRSVIWVIAVLLCGNVAATWLVGLGVGLFLARRNLRWPGVVLVAVGAASAAVVSAAGGAVGTLISNYAYLAGPTASVNVGLRPIVAGLLTHPSRGLHELHTRWLWTYRMVASSGLLGVINPLALAVTLAVLLPSDLNISPVFSGPISAFQNLPVYFFVPIGTAVALAWLSRSRFRIVRWAIAPIGLAILIQSLVLAATYIPQARTQFLVVDSAAATQLAQVEAVIPQHDEVVVSQGVLGRFSNRALIFPFLDISNGGQVVPVFHHQVIFILTDQGVEFATPAGTKTAVAYLRSIHAHQMTAQDGVFAFRWNPPAGTRKITFPATPPPVPTSSP